MPLNSRAGDVVWLATAGSYVSGQALEGIYGQRRSKRNRPPEAS
jgi:hypothetical protein